MNIQRICWRRSVQQSLPKSTRHFAAPAVAPRPIYNRGLTVPVLNHEDQMRVEGTPGLYSALGFNVAWTDYQRQMVQRVNELTAEGTLYAKDMKSLLIETARNPQQAAIFNHASMAWNNHFYFQSISATGPTAMPGNLKERLSKEFSSVEILKSEMLATAYAMFGPGFVWLVRTNSPRYQSSNPRQFKILTTYLAGSPLAGAHNRRQPLDMNVQNAASAELAGGLKGLSEAEIRRQTEPQNQVGIATNRNDTSFGGVNITPVLCVNTWEHAWMLDYSISGKMDFLNKWWETINWDVVLANSGISNDGQTSGRRPFAHSSFQRA